MIYKIKRLWNKLRYGLALQFITDRLVKIGIEFAPYYWIQEGLPGSTMPDLKTKFEGYYFEFFGSEEMKIIGEEKARGISEQELLKRLENGKKCYGVKYKGEIAAFMWFDLNESDFKPKRFPLNKREAYMYDMYTMKPFRGKGLAPYLRYKCYEILNSMGRDTLYSVSLFFNQPAVKFKKKLNAKFLQLVLYIELFRKFRRSFTIKSY